MTCIPRLLLCTLVLLCCATPLWAASTGSAEPAVATTAVATTAVVTPPAATTEGTADQPAVDSDRPNEAEATATDATQVPHGTQPLVRVLGDWATTSASLGCGFPPPPPPPGCNCGGCCECNRCWHGSVWAKCQGW